MSTSNFEQVVDETRWVRHLNPNCWISVLWRRTGFGWSEWETAICTKDPRDCFIIAGDRREELNEMPLEALMPWYQSNIEGNRNSFETAIETLKEISR